MASLDLKINCNCKELKKELKRIRWLFMYTSIVVQVCNWFRKDKQKLKIQMLESDENTIKETNKIIIPISIEISK